MRKSYEFQFSSNAEKQFSDLEIGIKRRVIKKLDFYEKSGDPLSFAKKLKGLENKFSFRVGDYRIIVSQKDNNNFVILIILKIGHRKEIYNDI